MPLAVIIREPASVRLQRMAAHLSNLAMDAAKIERTGLPVDLHGDLKITQVRTPDFGPHAWECVIEGRVRIVIGI